MSNSNFNSSNPFMSDTLIDQTLDQSMSDRMTISGAISKTFILFAILLVSSTISYVIPNNVFMWTGIIGGLIVVITARFKPEWSGWLAPTYAFLEGLFLGTISFFYASQFKGIVFQAITLTLAVLLFMLIAYKYRWIRVTEKFRSIIFASTAAIATFYLIAIIANFGFGFQMPMIHSNGWLGIGFSLFVVGLASMNLLLDFDNFEKGEQYGAPKYAEWLFGMSIMVTIVWLYVEILRLLSKISSRD